MTRHRIPAIANRLRINRGFDSVWFSDFSYGKMLQRDLLLSKHAWSWVSRASRSLPQSNQKDITDQPTTDADGVPLAAPKQQKQQQQEEVRDFPNFRPARVLMQHLPYKSVASVFAYAPPNAGPQAKYGLFQAKRR